MYVYKHICINQQCMYSIMPVGEQLVTMTETPYSLVIDHRSLKTVDRVYFIFY